MGPDELAALDCNYLDASRIFVSGSNSGEYIERKGVAIACCGLPVEALNWGLLAPPFDDVGARAAAVRSYFGDRKLPFNITLPQSVARRDDSAGQAAAELEGLGWRRKPLATPGMALATPAVTPAPPSGLAIEPVHSHAELVAFREVAFRGFGYPVAAARIFLHDRLFALPHVRLYSGLVDGTVVATSMTVVTGSVAGIYWVATLETVRGRGYGEALTWQAAAAGREFGCRLSSLQASEMGRPIYARMGFEHVLDYVHYLPAETA